MPPRPPKEFIVITVRIPKGLPCPAGYSKAETAHETRHADHFDMCVKNVANPRFQVYKSAREAGHNTEMAVSHANNPLAVGQANNIAAFEMSMLMSALLEIGQNPQTVQVAVQHDDPEISELTNLMGSSKIGGRRNATRKIRR